MFVGVEAPLLPAPARSEGRMRATLLLPTAGCSRGAERDGNAVERAVGRERYPCRPALDGCGVPSTVADVTATALRVGFSTSTP